jgi:hypothetical protein
MTALDIIGFAERNGLNALSAVASAVYNSGHPDALTGLREYAAYCIEPSAARVNPWTTAAVDLPPEMRP